MAYAIGAVEEPFDMNFFAKEVLHAHNVYRHLHNVPPLMLDERLSVQSQDCAQDLLEGSTRNENKYPTVGENIYIGTNHPQYIPRGVDPVNAWYHLRDQMDSTLNPDNDVNFTQLIWKNTRFLGVGLARSEEKIIMVCQYVPAGNIDGEYWHNVLPVMDDLEEPNSPEIAAGSSQNNG